MYSKFKNQMHINIYIIICKLINNNKNMFKYLKELNKQIIFQKL